MVTEDIHWLREILPLRIARELSTNNLRVSGTRETICLLCRGAKMLCGKLRCPILLRARSLLKATVQIDSPRIEGSTPPAVFVGRIGYPKVFVGPMVPPYKGNTEILDTPELWLGKPLQAIVDYRSALIRGSVCTDVRAIRAGNRMVESLQEVAMGKHPIDAEVLLAKIPKAVLTLSHETPPFGPSAPMRQLKLSDIKVDKRIEKLFYDRDLRADDAVVKLYEEGVTITRIQRAFSLGIFGLGHNRKLVPTRWSITAVDSIVSSKLIERIKQWETINEYRVYHLKQMDNVFVIIMMPERWSFEWIESWFPGTTWNPPTAENPAIMGDWEPYQGRKTYPDIGGCYYACRLAVAEKLNRERKQASVLALREIHPGYVLPVGVWFTRECVRVALRNKPHVFDSLQQVMKHISEKLTVPVSKWVENSALLRNAFFQKKITEFS